MTEEQLRDVLARVVPEPPDRVADPLPVVRAARVRRRAQVLLAGGIVAAVAVAAVAGGRALVDDSSAPQVVDEPSIAADPYSSTPCPDDPPASGPLPTGGEVVAVRYCGFPVAGFRSVPGPPDALVDDTASFLDAVAALPGADPARCAAISMMPGDDRLLLELADGSSVSVHAQMCQDVAAGDRTLDGGEVADAFLAALGAQRDRFDYGRAAADVDCAATVGRSPVRPGRESLVAAAWCFGGEATPIGPESLALLDDSWDRASPTGPASGTESDPCLGEEYPHLLAHTDRGDLVQLSLFQCERLSFTGWEPGNVYTLDIDVDELTES